MSMRDGVAELTPPVSARRDHVVGAARAPITLLEYGDYQCPFCGAAQQVVHAIRARLGSQLRFAYRHFPLGTVHPHAQVAAEAAEAAAAQGRFWDMHERLFAHQDALDAPSLLRHAAALDLDVPRFRDELAGRTHAARVREDFMSGVRSGVAGTPSFYVNGFKHEGDWSPGSLLSTLQAAG